MNFKLLLWQILLKMSEGAFRAIVINCIFIGVLYASNISAQHISSVKDVPIKVQVKNARLPKVLQNIEQQTNYKFSYKKEDLNNSFRISGQFNNVSVADVLLEISRQTGLKFKQINNNIHVSKKETNSSNDSNIEVIIQGIAITGKVTSSEDNSGLPGVNVMIKSTSKGTVTDVNGNYTLEVPSAESILIFSSVGFISEEVVVGQRTIVDLAMVPDMASLEEIVVIGYGSVKRSDMTGSTTTIAMDDIAQGSIRSINEAIQGRAAGVQVASSDGSPGGGLNIRIRGTSTINGKTEPLFIVDGIPINSSSDEQYVSGGIRETSEYNNNRPNPLSNINPNDIKSMEILKDASATAIYGSRGANGVVLITTKRGSAGKTRINADYMVGVQTVSQKFDRLTGPEYAARVNEGYVNGGYSFVKYDGSTWFNPLPQDAPTTYWQDLVYRNALIQDANVSLLGGTDATQYSFSIGYLNQEGILIGTGYDRLSTRLNLDQKVSGAVKIGTNLSFSRENLKQGSTDGINVVVSALTESPATEPDWKLEDEGRWFTDPDKPYASTNPVKLSEHMLDETIINRFIGNVYMEVDFSENLKWKSTAGIDYSFAERYNYLDRTLYLSNATYPGGYASITQNIVNNFMGNSYLTWKKGFGDHSVDAMVGTEYYIMERETRRMSDGLFATDLTGVHAIGTGADLDRAGSSKYRWQTAGFFGRLNYNYKSKYLVTANFRYDGSSRFGDDHKWGFFPSIAVGWTISKEAFLENVNWLTNLKLRSSYGLTGNGEIPINSSIGTWGVHGNQYSYNQNVVSGAYLSKMSNPDLKWETTYQFNIGLDMTLFDSRLGFIIDYFRKDTRDLILNVTIPKTTGYGSSRQNIGSLVNQGFEFTAYGVPISRGKFEWDTNLNLTILRSSPTNIGDQQFLDVASLDRRPGMRLEVGKPSGMIRGYIKQGVFETQEEANAAPYHGAANNRAGYYSYLDANGDNKIDANDIVPIGNGQPDFVFGFSNTLTYQDFDLYFLLQGSYGNEIAMFYDTRSPYEVMANEWTAEDPVNKEFAVNRRGGNGDKGYFTNDNYNVWNGSYARLRTIRLGYSIPVQKISWLRQAKINLILDNLLTLTDYPGYNPDVSNGGNWAFSEGWDRGAYPLAKVYKISMNFTF